MVGQTISHYRILKKLAGDVIGIVSKAADTRPHRIVALKFLLLILLAISTVLSAAAQQNGASVPPAQPADMHNSRNSLDWAGTYEGFLPCTDCPGTKTKLTLNYDGSYRLITQAQGSQNAEKSVSGAFTWQPSGNAVALDEHGGGQQFSVGEGRLTLLRPEGGASQSRNMSGNPTNQALAAY